MRGDIQGENLLKYRARPDWGQHFRESLKRRTYAPRACKTCGEMFTPASGRGEYCDVHVSSVTAQRRIKAQAQRQARRKHGEADFWRRVKKTSTCWLWTGPRNTDGYGVASIDGIREHVHRIAWRLVVDPNLSDGVSVKIRCDNQRCVNPAHMRTVDEAFKRKVARTYLLGRETQEQVAARFEVDRSCVSRWASQYGLSLTQEAQ